MCFTAEYLQRKHDLTWHLPAETMQQSAPRHLFQNCTRNRRNRIFVGWGLLAAPRFWPPLE